MISISLCMIVKNEEQVLARCLDSIKDLMDEIVIVDTGSTDRTKEIAAKYTDKIFDFEWIHDFSAARNFAFSKATCDYIYTADADEVLDSENFAKFQELKETLLPEIEIVQMKYGNQLQFNTIYNFDEELRPKLFKRLREFVWEAPIHEMVRLQPVIYDSDIVITHLPTSEHGGRDLEAFRRATLGGYSLPKRLHNIYAKELFIAGTDEDVLGAMDYFETSSMEEGRSQDEICEAFLVVSRGARISGDTVKFLKYITKVVGEFPCSEGYFEMGEFFLSQQDIQEAALWYYNACYEAEPVLDIKLGGKTALERLGYCYHQLGMEDLAQEYLAKAKKCDET
ncbi:MAG: glycosyltransferase family 2 protein [Lachnospiraceae bacterium]|nr:glycosyltransferase family 2 protein [Lachnospiraceae bacterium]